MSETICVREPIGIAWQDEVIWLPLASRAPVRVFRVGASQPLASQLAGSYRPDGMKEPPRVAVRLSLQPDEEAQLRIEAAEEKEAAGPFTFHFDKNEIRIANGRLEVRAPASAAFDPGEVPGPIIALRRSADAAWFGRGSWGPTAFAGRIETIIVDRGPLYARWI
ncbi:MAG: hypothetical protein N3A66_05645, partial [Planctomycetota bacterium]|nr:hypothetical protein [Planctomycetota bacterium]